MIPTPPAPSAPPPRWPGVAPLGALCLAATALLGVGCKTLEKAVDPSYRGPFRTNFNFSASPALSLHSPRRLAVLPFQATRQAGGDDLEEGRRQLQPLLMEQLHASRRFEVVPHSGPVPPALEGAAGTLATDALPHDLLASVAAATAADAVLFSQLTAYHPYPPIRVGLRFTMVDLRDGRVLWAFDDVFSDGEPATHNAARRHLRERMGLSPDLDGPDLVLASPQRFAHYSLGTALATIPPAHSR